MEPPRETAIVTAVNFLNNPKVARSTLIQKRNFLASKGLTNEEIQKAFEKVGIFEKMDSQDETRININSVQPYKHQMTTFEKIKDIISSAALISGLAYGIYLFYKKFIEPLLFGRKKGDKIDELSKTTKAINGELIRVRDEINKQKQTQEANHKLLQNTLQSFKAEIDTIKGILLNRKQFSSPSQSTGISIPSWQLSKKKNKDKNDDANSAHSNNSSENDTEVIQEEGGSQKTRSPANSDSSLEIM